MISKVLVLAGIASDGFQGDPVLGRFSDTTRRFLTDMLGDSDPDFLRGTYRYEQSAQFSPFSPGENVRTRKVCEAGVGPILAHEAKLASFDAEFAQIADFFRYGPDGLVVSDHWVDVLDDVEVVALSTTLVLTTPALFDMLSCLKEHGKIVIVGGVLVNKLQSSVLATLPFDYCLKTEAEGRFSTILKRLSGQVKDDSEFERIPGLLWRSGEELHSSDAAFELVDFANIRAMPSRQWVRERAGVYQYESVRGCPFRCEFCDYPFLMGNSKFRMKSAETIFSEWTELYELGVRHIDAFDSLFTVPRKRAIRLAELLIESGLSQHLTWGCFARSTELADPAFVELMKQGGCRFVFLGIESGSQEILDAMHKLTTVAGNAGAIGNCNNTGIYTSSGILVGFPGERDDTIAQTREFLAEHSSPSVHVFVWVPDVTVSSPVPIMQPAQVAKYGIIAASGRSSYGAKFWGRNIEFDMRTHWSHKSMDQAQALHHASAISNDLRSGRIKGEDFSFAPYRSWVQHPRLLASGMNFDHQVSFSRGLKQLFNGYVEGQSKSQIRAQVPAWLDASGLQASAPGPLLAVAN
jgi:tRNA A37 methylthiotransferase MiaB